MKCIALENYNWDRQYLGCVDNTDPFWEVALMTERGLKSLEYLHILLWVHVCSSWKQKLQIRGCSSVLNMPHFGNVSIYKGGFFLSDFSFGFNSCLVSFQMHFSFLPSYSWQWYVKSWFSRVIVSQDEDG